jgi:hypothetical protein
MQKPVRRPKVRRAPSPLEVLPPQSSKTACVANQETQCSTAR